MEWIQNIRSKISAASKSLGSGLLSLTRLEKLLDNLPFFMFLVLIAIIYIGNIHMAEKTIRKIDKLDTKMKEIRWEYMSTKADLMYKSKQTEVAKAVEPLGLKELTAPPKKIHLKE